MKPLVYLWTGKGYGKSTSAFGVAARAAGHKFKVVIVQFMKGRKSIGEYKFFSKQRNIKIKQFGKPQFIDLQNPSEQDKMRAQKALDYTKQAIKQKPFLLVLDEVNLAAAIGLVDKKEVLKIIDTASIRTNIYLTGRNAPKEFIKRADFVNIIKCTKRKFVKPRKGIEY